MLFSLPADRLSLVLWKHGKSHALRSLEGAADRVRFQLARELDHGGGAASAVVRAEEARDVRAVVVRADDDDAAGLLAGHRADYVAKAIRHGLEAAVREQSAELVGELAGLG